MVTSPIERTDKWEHPTLTHTRKLAAAPKGPPQVEPKVSTFPGRAPEPIPGQLTLDVQTPD